MLSVAVCNYMVYKHTLDTKRCHTLVDGVQSILCRDVSTETWFSSVFLSTHLFVPAFRYQKLANKSQAIMRGVDVYLGEKVVSENEYRSAMLKFVCPQKRDRTFERKGKGRSV